MSEPLVQLTAKRERLADLTTGELASRLADHEDCSAAKGLRTAKKIFRHAFANDVHGDVAWTAGSLSDAQIGRWAHPIVLPLSPRIALNVAEHAPSSDGTVRLLLRAPDSALIESVIIPADKGRNQPRTTLCLSSQVGCARACRFCETGVLGLQRQLSSSEIVDQFRVAQRICGDSGRELNNLVFMGMGEPFDNLREVLRALTVLTDQHGFAFPGSRITVSTVGVADRIAEFFAGTRAELAISLNAPDDVRRSHLMPINERFDLATLIDAVRQHMPGNRRVLFQYALFAGVNDSLQDAALLAQLVSAVRCRVNIIPANPGPDPALVAPSTEQVDLFVEALAERGVTTLVRRPRGRDIGGACGQLAGAARRRVGNDAQTEAPCL